MGNDPLKEYKYKEKLELPKVEPESEVQKINCPSCGNPVSADNLNIQTNIAKCTNCDGIFSIGEQVEKLSNQNKISQEILRPEGVELTYFQDELDISVEQPWGTFEQIFMSFFPFFLIMITSAFVEGISPSPIAKAGLITIWLASIIGYFAYFFIRKKHKIYFHIDDQYLSIERRPKKFIKDKKFAIQDIDQVYIKSIVSSSGAKGAGIFMIVNDAKGQKKVELIKKVSSRTKAKFIEQEIEKYLGIKDRRVPDEEI